MGEKQRKNIILVVMILIAAIIGVLGYLDKVSEFFNFCMVIIAFGLAVAIKLFVNQYIEKKQYDLINVISTITIFKLIILLFYLYFKMVHKVTNFEMQRFILEVNVMDSICVFYLCTLLGNKKRDNIQLRYVISIMIISILGCRVIPAEYLIQVRYLINGLNFVLACLIYRKWFTENVRPQSQAQYSFKIAFICYIIQLLIVIFAQVKSNKFYPAISVLYLMQAIYLFHFAFHMCLCEPWSQRINALNDAERLIKKQGEACDMIVNLSHELKTPVNIIRSALDLLILDYSDDEKILKKIRNVKTDCNQIMNLIQDMIDLQKIRGHYTKVNYKVYNLVEVVESVVDVFNEEVERCKIVFNPLEEEIYQEVDLSLMQQCFVLLFGMLCSKESENIFYIEMGKMNNQEHYLVVQHPAVEALCSLSKQIPKEHKEQSEVAAILTLKLIDSLFKMNHATMQYEKMKDILQIRIFFPSCTLSSDEWIDEMSLAILKDQVKGRDIEGASINC